MSEKSPLGLLALAPKEQDIKPRQHHDKIYRPSLKFQHVPDFNFTCQAGLAFNSESQRTTNSTAPAKNEGPPIKVSSDLKIQAAKKLIYPLESPGTSPRTKSVPLHYGNHKRSCYQHNSAANSSLETDTEINNKHRRTYVLPKPSPPTSTKTSIALPSASSTSTLNPLAPSFHPLPPPLPSHHRLTKSHYFPRTYLSSYYITNLLAQWHCDKAFMASCKKRELSNPFPGVDMNRGWNRARYEGTMGFQEEKDNFPVLRGGAQEKLEILTRLRGWSLGRQTEGIQWEAEDVKGVFDMVFVGDGGREGGRGCAWAREPGSWWGADKRLGLQMSCRGTIFIDELEAQTLLLQSQLLSWTQSHVSKPKAVHLKRGSDDAPHGLGPAHVPKRRKRARAVGVKLNGEAWRKRRREQERKAGRWLDGSRRMCRVWSEFFWVLNAADPRDCRWDREWKAGYTRYVSGKDIWG